MASRLGVYWSVMHRRAADYDYFKRLNPTVMKVMDGGDVDYKWIRDNLPDALVVARIHALSEQHGDMLKDPVGTGKRHAREWNEHQKRLGFDRANTLILGINEPRVWEAGMAEALRQYTIALCDEATTLGLRVGAMQLSVGWPANTGADTPPDWSPWHGVEAAIKRGNHVLVLHEYWADQGPSENWGWWAGRALKCPWQVPIVIGECGIDMYVKDGSVPHNARGWRGRKSPEQYAAELKEYADRMAQDKRFIGGTPFASDYANKEWFSFDVEPAYQAILALPPQPIERHTVRIPLALKGEKQPTPQPTQPSKMTVLTHPVRDPQYRRVTQAFGARPEYYSQYTIDGVPLKGHEGVDFGTPVGTVIVAVDSGVVTEVGDQGSKGYGKWVKVVHDDWGETVYAHLSRQTVRVGDKVSKGDPIGVSGETGNTRGAHLHFGLRVNPYDRRDGWGGYEDPMPYLLRQSVAPAPAPSQAVVDPLTALAFLDVEGGNVPFVGGLLTIRFEVHMFRVYLQNDALFDKHFEFVQGDYGAQYWRPNPGSAWMHAHGTMAQRHQALAFARSLNEDAALRATGMGLGQVMGSNHAVLGYPSPRAMFNAFAHREYGVNAQVLGFISFVMADAELLKAIRNQDWSAAARKYNGVGQEALYVSKLNNSMDKIRREVLA